MKARHRSTLRHPSAPRPPAYTDGARKRLLARIHILAGELKLDDDVYRDVLERVGGARSAALLDDTKLYIVVRHFEKLQGNQPSSRPIADSPMARRARALWTNLWNLDELEDGSERALAAFTHRQTGREDMRFCNAKQLSSVIEALKDMNHRAGVELPEKLDPLEARRRVAREQWRRLHAHGWAKAEGDHGLAGFAHKIWATPNSRSVDQMEADHLDTLIAKLGRMLREKQLGLRHSNPSEL